MDDSYMDDHYFYNPLNSLSHSDANDSLNTGKYATINQNPVVLARQANTIDVGPVLDKMNTSSIPAAPQLGKKESSFKTKPQETMAFQSNDAQQILDLKMPSLKQIPSARMVMNSQRSPMESGKILADIIEVQPRRLKIFDEINTSTLISEKSQLFKQIRDPMQSLNTSLVDVVIESKPVHSFEDLLVQKSMFLTTKFTEATVNEFLMKAQSVITQVQPLKQQHNTLIQVYDRIEYFRNALQTNLDQSMDLKDLKLDFKTFYDEMLSLECNSNVPNMDQSKQILENRFTTIQQLEIAMKNLLELRKDILLLQSNQHFIAQFYINLDLLKIANRFVKFEGNNLINNFTSFLKHETLQLAYEIS